VPPPFLLSGCRLESLLFLPQPHWIYGAQGKEHPTQIILSLIIFRFLGIFLWIECIFYFYKRSQSIESAVQKNKIAYYLANKYLV
jgi:hypothetical protein